MTKAAFFKFAHEITKHKNIAFFGSYAKAFAAVLRSLYAQGYMQVTAGFQIVEPVRWAGTPSRR